PTQILNSRSNTILRGRNQTSAYPDRMAPVRRRPQPHRRPPPHPPQLPPPPDAHAESKGCAAVGSMVCIVLYIQTATIGVCRFPVLSGMMTTSSTSRGTTLLR